MDLYNDGQCNFDGFMALMEQYKKPMPTAKDLQAAFARVALGGGV